MSEELLDILDETGEKTGEVRTYNDAHRFGLIHRGVHVWVLNNKHELLLQQRSADRRAYPSYWDISASGHVSAGETSLEGAKKELREELHLDLPDASFEYLGTLEEYKVLNEGTYVNNEFQDVYLVRLEGESDDIRFDSVELGGIRWVTLEEFKILIEENMSMLVPHPEEYQMLLKYLVD